MHSIANQALAGGIEQRIAVERFFSETIHEGKFGGSLLARFLEYLRRNLALFRKLSSFDTNSFRARDIALFHTLSHNELAAVRIWHRLIPEKRRPHLVVLLRYTSRTIDAAGRLLWRPKAWYYWLGLLLYRNAKGVSLTTDSAVLAEEFAELAGGAPVSVLPIPHIPVSHEEPDLSANSESPGQIRIVVLGDARQEKGFPLIAEVAPDLAAKHADIRFVIQCNHGVGEGPWVHDAIRTLSSSGERIELIREALDEEKYDQLLRSANLVLLPYDPGNYLGRTSGIFAEALALGIPVVATQGTWMAHELRQLGLGNLIMETWSAAGLRAAIERFLTYREEQRSDLAKAVSRWRDFHSADRYLDILDRLVADT